MRQRMAGIDDILDHQHIAPFDLSAQVFEDTHLAAAVHAVAIGRGFQKIDLDRQVQFTHQIGDEHKRPPQQAHHDQLVSAGKFGRDLAGKAFDPCGNGFGADHLVDDIGGVVRRASFTPVCDLILVA